MAKEIERKFLVRQSHANQWKQLAEPVEIQQGYLAREEKCTVRVRRAGNRGWLTVKGRVQGISRDEYEVEIPLTDAVEMLEGLCQKPLIHKYRYRVAAGNVVWEIDEFLGANAGLVVAEVELDDPEQSVDLPGFVGEEVTGDPRYFNSNLVLNPFGNWPR